jgi:hypothetical protein
MARNKGPEEGNLDDSLRAGGFSQTRDNRALTLLSPGNRETGARRSSDFSQYASYFKGLVQIIDVTEEGG